MFIRSGSHDVLIIAEVGQNHQGDLETAIEYIKVFAERGADVIKFQTRNNKYLFSEEAYHAVYNSENAFAETYGAHREMLELKPEWYPVLKEECQKLEVKFMSTPFDEPSLDFLIEMGVDMIKISSFDLGNLPFINRIAQANKPVIISTGGGRAEVIDASVDLLVSQGVEVAILHCVSEYPCPHNRLGLGAIPELIDRFPNCTIGLSDHFNGTLSGPIGYMNGARVFEKHVTLNRAWKGTDHPFALEPHGFRSFVRDIQRTPEMLVKKPDEEIGIESVFKKLGKSLVAARDLQEGSTIGLEDLAGRIFSEQFIPVRESCYVIGKRVKQSLKEGEVILKDYLL